MRIGFVELVLLLFIASITVGPNVALFVDRWLRRAQRTSAAAARRKAQLEAQAAIEREALMTRFRVASNIFALLMLAALAPTARTAGSWAVIWAWTASAPRTALSTPLPTTVRP